MSEEAQNGNGTGLPASSTDPNEITVVTPDDAMYLRIARIGEAMMGFYDMIAMGNVEETEKFFEQYPKTAEAKLRIAPVAFARLIPVKTKIIREDDRRPRRRMTPEEIKELNLSKQQLMRLAEGEVK